jgi:hypothetical protein
MCPTGVQPKTTAQRDLQTLHRARALLVWSYRFTAAQQQGRKLKHYYIGRGLCAL